MIISDSLFLFIAFVVIWLVICILCTVYSLISKKETLKDALLTVPRYLMERFSDFFSGNVIVGLCKSFYFTIFILFLPLFISFLMVCLKFFGNAYIIIEEEAGYHFISCTIIGNSITIDGKSVKVDKDMYYIINNTDKNFCLKQEFYSRRPLGLPRYRSSDKYEENVYINPHSYIETEHKPEFWLVAPYAMSSKSTKVEEDVEVWGVILDD